MKRLVAALALIPLLAACPDDKIKPTDSPLERARERTNTNVDHDTKSPLDSDKND